jgi:hypothetical protein
MMHCNRQYLKQEASSDSCISQAVTRDESRCQCWGPVGHRPILGKRHDVEERQLAERHVRHACKKKGKKDNWQEKQWERKMCMQRRKVCKANMQEDLTRLGFW